MFGFRRDNYQACIGCGCVIAHGASEHKNLVDEEKLVGRGMHRVVEKTKEVRKAYFCKKCEPDEDFDILHNGEPAKLMTFEKLEK